MDVQKTRETIEAAMQVAVDKGYRIVAGTWVQRGVNVPRTCCALGAVAVANDFDNSQTFDDAVALIDFDEDDAWSFVSGFDQHTYNDHKDVPELRALGAELRAKWIEGK